MQLSEKNLITNHFEQRKNSWNKLAHKYTTCLTKLTIHFYLKMAGHLSIF